MGYVEGTNRGQTVILALDEMVSTVSIARILDRFVEAVHLNHLGFTNTVPAQIGRPSYSPSPMMLIKSRNKGSKEGENQNDKRAFA